MKVVILISFFFLTISISVAQQTGNKVQFTAVDGKVYTGVIRETSGNKYKIKYDGFDYEAWLSADQFSLINTARGSDILSIYSFGKQQGWGSPILEKKLFSYLAGLSAQDKLKLVNFINQAVTQSAKYFALKSLIFGDNYTIVQKFITELNQYNEAYQQKKCLVTRRQSIIQQWQYSCSVTTVQTFLGDLSPRYAWDVKRINNFDAIANDPQHPMSQQQKELLEQYGGTATPRGDYSGKSIGLLGPLNEYVGKLLGVTFYAQQITEPLQTVFNKVRSQLERGINVPLLIGFAGDSGKHFILVMKYRYTAGEYEYMLYDPWSGLCDYVAESNLSAGSMAPINSSWSITIDYYYPTYE